MGLFDNKLTIPHASYVSVKRIPKYKTNYSADTELMQLLKDQFGIFTMRYFRILYAIKLCQFKKVICSSCDLLVDSESSISYV